MSDNAMTKDSIKFWTFLAVMLLGVAVAVTFIDLTIKASILAEAAKIRAMMGELEAQNGPKQEGRIGERDSANGSHNGHFSGDVLDTGDAGMEARRLGKLAQDAATKRPRVRRQSDTSDGD